MVWAKAGSTTLGSAGDDIDITSMTASKFNTALMHIFPSGSTGHRKRFGSGSIDTGSNYAERVSLNGASDVTYTSQDRNTGDGQSAGDRFQVEYGINIATEEKLFIYFDVNATVTGAGTAPKREEYVSKWVNTSDQYDQRRSYNALSGSYNTDSNVSVLGSDLTPSAGKPTNVQAGSRFEETDTRKMYHNVVLTNGTTSENVGWYEAGTTTPQYPPTRGVWASGYTNTGSPSGDLVIMDYVTIATTGNAINFGNLTLGRATPAGVSSYTRGVIGGGITSSASAEYITITTTGNATSFGNLTVARSGASSATNRSRGVWAGGTTGSNTDVIDYITIDTTGNATDFGNLVAAKRLSAGLNSATRGCFAGGYISGASNTIDYITIASTGNATDFGDLSRSNYNMGAVSSDTRGVWAGGNGNTNVMDYITIATTGNATDFGDMNVGISGCGGNSDLTRGVFAGGWITNAMEYITIATTGNGTDFGDLTVARDAPAGGLVG